MGADRYGALISSINLNMLDVLGDDFISQHILQTLRKEREERLYRNYIADALYAVTTKRQMTRRYAELVEISNRPAEKRSVQEVQGKVMNSLFPKG